jgi:peptide-methionine (S)-S-oxide reductase
MKNTLAILAALTLLGFLALARSGGADKPSADQAPAGRQLAKATFAGGCFWCVESDFDKVEGVVSTTSGYTGGQKKNPSYEEVSAGGTGHAESVQVVFDPAKVSYAKLLEVYWHSVDPLTPNQQFCDHGNQYRTAIFYHDAEQKRLAEESKARVQQELQAKLHQPVVTQIVAASTFYPAEEYHQDYYKKNPIRYKFYRTSCGRDNRLEEIWGNAAGH